MVDYKQLATRLSVAIKEFPKGEDNAKRIWEIWTQVQLFDPRDHFTNFSTFSGLPDGVTQRCVEVCRAYQNELATTRRPAKQ